MDNNWGYPHFRKPLYHTIPSKPFWDQFSMQISHQHCWFQWLIVRYYGWFPLFAWLLTLLQYTFVPLWWRDTAWYTESRYGYVIRRFLASPARLLLITRVLMVDLSPKIWWRSLWTQDVVKPIIAKNQPLQSTIRLFLTIAKHCYPWFLTIINHHSQWLLMMIQPWFHHRLTIVEPWSI